MKLPDLYTSITAEIVRQLEAGTPPWVKPWKDSRVPGVGMIPSNLVTGRTYSGSNVLLLWLAASANGWDSLQYCTFHQVNSIGAKVKKGSKSVPVIFTKHVLKQDEGGEDKRSTIVKVYPVFHVSQLEAVDDKYLNSQQPLDMEPANRKVSSFVKGTGIPVEHGSNQAAYYPARDVVVMPIFGAFSDEAAYTGVLMHELTHATSHITRCNRELGKRFGDEKYAFEELVAELGSAFLCGRLGYQPSFRSASYINTWLKVLKNDNRAIFSAASYAGQASDWLWNKANPEEEIREAAE